MRNLFIITIVFLFTLATQAQTKDYYVEPTDSTLAFSGDTEQNIEKPYKKLRLKPELRIGTSFGSFGGSPYMSEFISPSIRIQPPGKFSIIVGTSLTFSNNLYQYAGVESTEPGYFEKMASYQLYAMGAYQVNPNLQIRGGISVSYLPGINPDMMSPGFTQGHFGFDLKVTDKTWISADFNFGQGSQYYPFQGYNPYQTNAMPGFYPYHGF